MVLKQKTLEKLRTIINEESEYRSGPQLVSFFHDLGFNDQYGQGFPSRWIYTDEKLKNINGAPELDQCIKNVFDPEHYIGDIKKLDELIKSFNAYLAFDGWKIIRTDALIIIEKYGGCKIVEVDESSVKDEDSFLQIEFGDIKIEKIGLNDPITTILKGRIEEIKRCIQNNAPLSVIFLSGSILEGIFLGLALLEPSKFNQSTSAPKDNKTGKVKNFQDWTLSNFIDVAYNLGYIKLDTKKFSHSLRDFRNYIHPYQQMAEHFSPDEQTAKISWQVLKAAICQIIQKKNA
jgi:hypothetical protein